MIVDSSAALAILFAEPGARRHAAAMMAAYPCRMFKGEEFARTDIDSV